MKTIHDVLDRKNNFDAIRLLAAIGVILSHAYPVIEGSNKNEFLYILSGGQTTLGELCVAIFFVISGFLITQSFLRSKSLIEYFVNRVFRIVPALAIVTLATCLILGPIITHETNRDYWSNYLTVRYVGNALIYPGAQKLPGVFTTNAYPFITNASIWTLSYEFTCYIFLAALGLAGRRAWLLALLMLSSAAATVLFTYISPLIFFKFASYFLAGSIAYAGRKWIVLNFWLFVISVAILCLSITIHRGLVLTFCVFGTYATMYLAYAYYLNGHNIAHYGDFSYGVYLYAWPVQQVLAPYSASPFVNFFLSLPIILIFAVCSWAFIEKPSLSKKKIISSLLKNGMQVMRIRLFPTRTASFATHEVPPDS